MWSDIVECYKSIFYIPHSWWPQVLTCSVYLLWFYQQIGVLYKLCLIHHNRIWWHSFLSHTPLLLRLGRGQGQLARSWGEWIIRYLQFSFLCRITCWRGMCMKIIFGILFGLAHENVVFSLPHNKHSFLLGHFCCGWFPKQTKQVFICLRSSNRPPFPPMGNFSNSLREL